MKLSDIKLIPHIEIPQNNLLNRPLIWFDVNNKSEDSLQGIQNKFKKICSYKWANSNVKWSNVYGHLFSIQVHKIKYSYKSTKLGWNIHIWDHTGTTTIISLIQSVKDENNDYLTKDNYKLICNSTERFVKGFINCSDCGNEIKQIEKGGRYFAGTYCQECWDRKWKEIEARETYN